VSHGDSPGRQIDDPAVPAREPPAGVGMTGDREPAIVEAAESGLMQETTHPMEPAAGEDRFAGRRYGARA
jgi:hypothetical protein